MEYKTVQASERSALDNEVNWYLQNGWKPQGGVSSINALQGFVYIQAIIREEQDK